MSFRCRCGHRDDQHFQISGDEGHERSFGTCLANCWSGHACRCNCFDGTAEIIPTTGSDCEAFGGPGYHLANIKKGILGELSKVREELDELIDAELQGAVIMQLCETADLIGAVRAWLKNHHPEVSFVDVVHMADLTERAFESGRRK